MSKAKVIVVTDKTLPVRFMVNNDVKHVMHILHLNDVVMTKKELVQTMNQDICRCIFDGPVGIPIGLLTYHRYPKHIEILHLYAHLEYNAKFIFSQFIDELKERIGRAKKDKLLFWVYDGDLELQLFLQDNGFRATKVKDDEYLMECKL